ncbi:MAG: hypothetical protein Kapaf2KO_21120 [Candidatus Kapaibacteriales bacterium]
MSILSIEIASTHVLSLIREMDRNGMLKIINDKPEKGNIAHLLGSLNMSDERLKKFDKYIKESRKEWDERLSARL